MTIRQLLLRDKVSFGLYLFGCLLTMGSGIFFTFALSNLLSIFGETTSSGVWHRIILTAIFVYTPIVLQFLSRQLRIKFMNDTILTIRNQVFDNLLKQPYATFRQQSQATHMAHLVADINLFEKDFFLSLLNIIYHCGSYLLGIIVLFFINPLLILTLIPVSILLLLITFWFEPQIKQLKQQTQQANMTASTEISNILEGLEIIKLYHVESYFLQPFKTIIISLESIKNITFKKHALHESLNYLISFSYQMLIIIYITFLFAQDQLTLSSMIIIFNLMGQMVWSMTTCFSFINRLKAAITVYQQITSTTATQSKNASFHFQSQLQLTNLSYQYEPDKPVLKNLDLTIVPNSKILITGPSGTGKTTLLDCLTQNLIDFTGDILYDGTSVKNINDNEFLKHCSYIRQQHFLFNDTIKNNIILNQDYHEAKLNRVLVAVDLKDWVDSLPDKHNHLLTTNGHNISGGQRQRLSIARALYHDKQVLFVDEPAASLDDTSAFAVYQTLFNLPITVICVSHRHLDYLEQHVDQVINLNPPTGGIA